MSNCNVKCNVCECKHNDCGCNCCLGCIEISHENTGADAVATPHFCKSYEKK